MAAAYNEEENTKANIMEKINSFFQKKRKLILFAFLAVIIVIVVLVIGISVRDKMLESALTKFDEFDRRHNELHSNGHDANNEKITALLADLENFAKSGYPAARSFSLCADILMEQKNYSEAEAAYIKAAKAAGKSYFAPVCYFNAAVAAEEQENIDAAITNYTSVLECGDNFPAAARAQFSIGRLEESKNNKSAALEAYGNIIAKWPDDQLWANLAHSRIIALED